MYVYSTPKYDDFTGFTFNGKHSSEFGLLRVSNGDRYEDNLVPALSDEAADIPGGHGQYYWGETIKNREFKVDIAYDNIGEIEKVKIRKWLHPDDRLHELIFDERPYIKYWVKCSKEVNASELCFNETYTSGTDMFGKPIQKIKRVYKGNFTIIFTAYMPFGQAVSKNLNDFDPTNPSASFPAENYSEWADSAGLLDLSSNMIDNFSENTVKVYNAGDIETGFKLNFNIPSNKNSIQTSIASAVSTLSINESFEGFTSYDKLLTDYAENEELYIFYQGKPSLIMHNGLTFPNVNINNQEGRFVEVDNVSKIESLVDGNIYEIFTKSEVPKFIGTSLNPLDMTSGYRVYGLVSTPSLSNVVREIYIHNVDNILNTITFSFPNGDYPTEDFTIDIAKNSQSQCQIGLKNNINETNYMDGYSFKLNFPAAATIHPENWTESQKALFYGGSFKIDSDSGLINYKRSEEDNWSGLRGIISDGNLFKLPPDDILGQGNVENQLKVLSIDDSNTKTLTINNPQISYQYLYIG